MYQDRMLESSCSSCRGSDIDVFVIFSCSASLCYSGMRENWKRLVLSETMTKQKFVR